MNARKLRVAYAGFFHETNTYVTEFSGKTTLERMTMYSAAQLPALKGSAIGGPVDECLENGWELLPATIYLVNDTFGLVDEAAYTAAKERILSELRAQMPIDICYLLVHSSGVVENINDLEGDLARSVRQVVGPHAKICTSVDLHGKMTDLMASEYDFFSACKEYPHNDLYACARDALRQAADALLGKTTPVFSWQRIPLMIGPSSTLEEGSFAQLLRDQCLAYEQQPGVLNCSVMHGFPYQDTAYCGMYTLVTTDNDIALAQRISRQLAQWMWDNRALSQRAMATVDIALEQASKLLDENGRYVTPPAGEQSAHKPIIIGDIGDNPGGGAPGDTTHLLRAVMAAGDLGKVAFMSIHDPETVRQAIEAGVGATIDVRLGAKYDCPRGGDPIVAKAYVKSISDGQDRVRGPMCYGMTFNLGPTVRLHINGVDVVVISGLGQAFDDVQGRPHGIIVEEYDLVCVKGSAHWRGFYSHVTPYLLVADSPGITSVQLDAFQRTQLDGPIYPLDMTTVFTAR